MTKARIVGFVLSFFCCAFSSAQTSPSAASAQQSPSVLAYAPAPGSPLRKEILDYIRPFCEQKLHQPVIFNVLTLCVSNDTATGILIPLRKNGHAILAVQRYLVILSRVQNKWRLETLRPNPNDAEVANAIKWSVLPTTPRQSEIGLTPTNETDQKEAQEKRNRDLDQREAELNRRSAELDRKAAEVERKATELNRPTPAPTIGFSRRDTESATLPTKEQ
jgi:hypothetical protein